MPQLKQPTNIILVGAFIHAIVKLFKTSLADDDCLAQQTYLSSAQCALTQNEICHIVSNDTQ